jgi:thioredoxin reductase (NADPH)
VTVIHRRDAFRAEKIMQDRLFDNDKVKVLWDSVVEEVVGSDDPPTVTGVKVKNVKTGATTTVPVEGMFVAIGHTPNTQLFKGQLGIDSEGYIVTRPGTTQTDVAGVFAAGDVQDKVFRQAVTAAGTGCMAAIEAERWLATNSLTRATAAE